MPPNSPDSHEERIAALEAQISLLRSRLEASNDLMIGVFEGLEIPTPEGKTWHSILWGCEKEFSEKCLAEMADDNPNLAAGLRKAILNIYEAREQSNPWG